MFSAFVLNLLVQLLTRSEKYCCVVNVYFPQTFIDKERIM